MENKEEKYFIENLIIIILFSSTFLPTFATGTQLKIRLDDILILYCFPLILLSKKQIVFSKITKLWILPLFSMMFSILYGYCFLGVPTSFRDFFEIIRYLKPIFIFLILSSCNIEVLILKIDKYFKVGSFLLILIALLQYFNFFGLGFLMARLYGSDIHANALVSSFKRITLTGANANVGAGIVLMFLLKSLVDLLIDYKLKDVVLCLLLITIMFMTSSRTTIIAFCFVILCTLIFVNIIKLRYKLLIIVIMVILFYILYQRSRYISLGYELLVQGKLGSVNTRIDNFSLAIKLFFKSPILGWGVAKSIHPTFIDGEHILLLRRYGLMGHLLVLFSLGYYPIKLFFDKRKFLFENKLFLKLRYFCFFLFVVAIVIMITNKFFSGNQMIISFSIFFGLEFLYLKKIIREMKS